MQLLFCFHKSINSSYRYGQKALMIWYGTEKVLGISVSKVGITVNNSKFWIS